MVSIFHYVWCMCHGGLHIFQKCIYAHFFHLICVCFFLFWLCACSFSSKIMLAFIPIFSSSNHSHVLHLFHVGIHCHCHCDLNMMSNFGCFLITPFFLFMFIAIIVFISFCLDHGCVFSPSLLLLLLVFIVIVVIISFHPNFSHVFFLFVSY